MLIQALAQYYDVLDKNGLLVEEGGERVPIDYLIALDSEGIIKKIIPIYTEITTVKTLKNGKKKSEKIRKSQYIILPERPDITSTYSYYLEHRAKYIFGLESFFKDIVKFIAKHIKIIPNIRLSVTFNMRKMLEPKKPPNDGIIKWNIATMKGNKLKYFVEDTIVLILKDNEKVSMDNDIPIKKMDTKSLILSPY